MENEKRLIDANALVPYLWSLFKFFGSIPCTEADKATQQGIKRCIGEIKKMPTVDAVEVVHGRWESTRFGDIKIATCSACGTKQGLYINGRLPNFNYCPNCGAKMDGDGNA